MTIRKLWLFVLLLMAVISILINSFILSVLTDKYFSDYRAEEYDKHISEILDYTKSALLTGNFSVEQMSVELETHLDDPIIHIKLYDQVGNLLVDVSEEDHIMMGRSMMSMMGTRYDETDSEVDDYQIVDRGKTIGQLNITRYSSLDDSIVARNFKSNLLTNSLYAMAIVLILAVFVGIFVSKKMSTDLSSTAKIANNISLGEEANASNSNIHEIRTIQQSLLDLSNKLKLKNKSRKTLIDELVHQTRTPLTVLKTHLEGLSDHIIEMTPEEIQICENQIENITAIISNMSSMIDAQKDFDVINIEEFEISNLLKQITNGLKAQFKNKKISLELKTGQKVVLNSDKYKLSQAIYNILTNAYKFTPENGTVSVEYRLNNSTLDIAIKDDGVGMSEAEQSRIFDAYYSGGKNGKGNGLGLFIAKENVEKLKGNIQVSSKIGQGSEFNISIPLKYQT